MTREDSMMNKSNRILIEGSEVLEIIIQRVKRSMPQVYNCAIRNFADYCIRAITMNKTDNKGIKLIKHKLRKHMLSIIADKEIPFKERIMYLLRSI